MWENFERCTEWEKNMQEMRGKWELIERCTECEKIKQKIYWREKNL